MQRFGTILRWTLGIIIALYLALALAINIPAVQRTLAGGIAHALGKKLDTKVAVERVQAGLNGRLIVDGVTIKDKQGETMLKVMRAGVRINLREILKGRIRIGNAQLYGLKAQLYQEQEQHPANYQFVLDAFASKDTTSSSIDLRIGQVVIRRANITWDQRWKPKTPGRINTSHLALENLNVTGQLNTLKNDTINLELKRFDVCEQSGLCIKELHFDLAANKKDIVITDFHLALPHSVADIPRLTCHLNGKEPGETELEMNASIASQDLIALTPSIGKIDNIVNLDIKAHGSPDDIQISHFKLHDTKGLLSLDTKGSLYNLTKGIENAVIELDINELKADGKIAEPYVKSPLLAQIGKLELKGPVRWDGERGSGNVNISTAHGDLTLHGEGRKDGTINGHVISQNFQLGNFLKSANTSNLPIGSVAMDMDVKGKLPNNLTLKGRVPLVEYKNYPYRNIEVNGTLSDRKRYEGTLAVNDINIALQANGKLDLEEHIVKALATIQRISPHALNLTERYPETQFSGTMEIDLQGSPWDNMAGKIFIDDLTMTTPEETYKPGNIHITSKPEEKERHLLLISPFLEAQIDGEFTPQNLIGNFKHIASTYLPTLITADTPNANNNDYGSFVVKVYNAEPLRRLTGIKVDITQPLVAQGNIDSSTRSLGFTAKAPSLKYGNEELRNIDIRIESNQQSLQSTIQLQRLMKGKYVDIGLETSSLEDRLMTRFYWNNQRHPVLAGDINMVSQFYKDFAGKQAVKGEILPSNIIVGDSLWSVFPGALSYHDGILEVDSLGLGSGDHYLTVNGRASKEETDTLHAKLHKVKLEYIFSLINFHAVEMTGEATGNVYARNLFSKPYLDAFLQVPQFALNYGVLGDLDIYGNWGRQDYSIYLDGVINDAKNDGRSLVKGYVTPKKDIAYHGIDLSIQAERLNMYFLNKYTHAIFDDLEGRATGWARVFGPFKKLNIEGDVMVNEGSMGIPYLGVRYHLENDSVILRPDNIYFTNADIYDPQGNPDQKGHRGKVNGHLTHQNFSNLCYDINIEGDNILGYDFKEFGDQTFYGTVLATGNVTLNGCPGQIDINIKAKPEQGTSITYNATSPDKITQTQFITYVDRNAPQDTTGVAYTANEAPPSSDMRINFDLDIDQGSTMNLLMDAKSGDMITLNGRGHMLARYYNKGNFQLFGTYRVEKGTYGLSLQEIIQKNFDIQDGGTVVFSGDPYDADLNIQAIHTVTGVSLNDISARATFSNTSARVNCLMNVSGKARQPHITFDFDILNVNEDEKQMVRSLISTEEERNMQVVYLLGIGRFYTYDYSNDTQSQSYTAMNSLLSSTLSGQLNQMLSNMIGNSNWNFGANLSTGEDGWNDMDVEGILQGNLLNNRLLLNGNFGYRDKPMSSTNFIGDFDAQYHLTRSGSVSLKAYSETNDRYFTKSSLTTQGIGILLKKDFSSLRELFTRKSKKP